MDNRDRILKLFGDLKEWKMDFRTCMDSLEKCDKDIKKIIFHSVRAYFLDFHILCEDYISLSLKELNKFKIDISAIEGMEILKNYNKISVKFFEFYCTSRRLRNRLAHRYKMPTDEELLSNLKNNFDDISELEQSIKRLIL